MEEDPKVSRLVVAFLRSYADMTQVELAMAAGMDQGHISRFESGKKVPSEEILRRLAKAAGVHWPLVAPLRRFCATFSSAAARPELSGPGDLDVEMLKQAVLEPVLLAVDAYLLEDDS
jgi:transcriptional regulator with XRE-family HTH domain